MIYIQQARCISPQETFLNVDLSVLHAAHNNQLVVIEPAYPGVSPGILRRMGKAGRIGMGTAMDILQQTAAPDGIVIGTANGGMEESVRFIRQIVEYNEDMLAPGNFVQSTANATAAQLAMLTKNTGYNITHVHRALAFENSLLDVIMLLKEDPLKRYLTGGVDEIASYNFQIESAAGWYKKEEIANGSLYQSGTIGSIAGEGAAMFMLTGSAEHAIAVLHVVTTVHAADLTIVSAAFQSFLEEHFSNDPVDLLLSGENGDSRYDALFATCEQMLPQNAAIARFKHMCGEYPTASAFALWLACQAGEKMFPPHIMKREGNKKAFRNILIMNSHHGTQHSFMRVSLPLP